MPGWTDLRFSHHVSRQSATKSLVSRDAPKTIDRYFDENEALIADAPRLRRVASQLSKLRSESQEIARSDMDPVKKFEMMQLIGEDARAIARDAVREDF